MANTAATGPTKVDLEQLVAEADTGGPQADRHCRPGRS